MLYSASHNVPAFIALVPPSELRSAGALNECGDLAVEANPGKQDVGWTLLADKP